MLARLKQNIPSAIVVFLVALPLCLGIAFAQGASPLAGIITGVIGGIVVGAFGASHIAVAGPSAGLTLVVLGALADLGGFPVLSLAIIIAGVLQIGLAFLKFGLFSKFIPGSVIRGLLAAVGIIIILKQIPHLFGYDSDFVGDMEFIQPDGHNTFSELWIMTRYLNATAILISVTSVALLVTWHRFVQNRHAVLQMIPGALVAVVAAVFLNMIAGKISWLKDLTDSHLLRLPGGASFSEFGHHFANLDFSLLLRKKEVWSVALTLAIVGSFESLLGLEAADKIDPQRRVTDKKRELCAQGAANVLSGFAGGLPLTTVIIRTVTNANSGATHRSSTIMHGVLLLLALFVLPSVLNLIPLAALAVIIAAVGYRLSSYEVFREQWVSGKEQFVPFVVTIIAVIFSDVLIGTGIGFLVALGFILRSNFQKGYFSSIKDGEHLIRLTDDISFMHRASFSEELRQIPNGAKVTLYAENPQRIHHDIAELITEFRESAPNRNIILQEKNLPYIPEKTDLKSVKSVMYRRLLHGNRSWVAENLERDRLYFDKLASGQEPQVLWIGCADSRVPPNEITKTEPGEIFIHRNVANLVVHTDLNMLSVLQYAVEVLKVKQVIVCGHYECGGVAAAMKNVDLGLANKWLRNIKEVYAAHAVELEHINNRRLRERMFVELNVIEQVRNLAKTTIIQKAWKKRQIELHGWVVDLSTGYIRELPIKMNSPTDLEPIFRYKV
jgi:carbonic anhydrase